MVHILIQIHLAGTFLKRIRSFRQWAFALILFAGFSAATLFGYLHNHGDFGFETFAEDFFLSELQANPIHLHYSIENPESYHIEEAQLKMPVYQPGTAADDVYSLSLLSTQLKKYNQTNLSTNNQYLYGLLDSYLNNVKLTAAYPYLSEPLSPSSGAPSELPILLAEYRFDDAADVELYLSILEQIPAYFDGLIVFEREKSQAGLFMSDATADKVIRQCYALMDPKQLEGNTHFLELTFAQRLQQLVDQGLLTKEKSLSYQSQNNRLLTTVVAPAYERLADELTLLKGSGMDTCGLAYYEGGREYYEALLRLRTGSCRNISQIRQMLYLDLAANYEALGRLLENNDSLRESLASDTAYLPEMTPEEMLSYLESNIGKDYPAIPSNNKNQAIDCTVKYVDDSLEPYTAPAFYMTPPIDNVFHNTIYINELDTSDDLSLFTTLAHEGYPGHLYQTVFSQNYWMKSGITPLRNVLYYGGFIEGWAMYAEMSSYDYAIELAKDSHPQAQDYYLACRLDRQIQLCLYALLDLAIHYDGASLEDVREIFASLGSADENTIAAIYSYIAQEPCNYPKYYLGYLEIMELKKQAAALWCKNHHTVDACHNSSGRDSSDVQSGSLENTVYADHEFLYYFHSFLLENGPADFGTLSMLLQAQAAPK